MTVFPNASVDVYRSLLFEMFLASCHRSVREIEIQYHVVVSHARLMRECGLAQHQCPPDLTLQTEGCWVLMWLIGTYPLVCLRFQLNSTIIPDSIKLPTMCFESWQHICVILLWETGWKRSRTASLISFLNSEWNRSVKTCKIYTHLKDY